MKDQSTTQSIPLFGSPTVWLIRNFLSEEECSHLIRLAGDKLDRSAVMNGENGESELSGDRSSWQTSLNIRHDSVVAEIEQRLAQHVSLPVEHGEGMQVIRYGHGQEFKPHHDYFDPALPGFAETLDRRGQRRTTVLMYLSAPEAGGETIFPAINLRIKPTTGYALCFKNLLDDGSLDVKSLHGSLPVSAGEKWVATKFLHEKPIVGSKD